jgi:hypothetical protein
MSYPTDKDILERLPASCPELAAIFFPGYPSGFKHRSAVSHINRKLKSMERYRMVRFTGSVKDRAKVWERIE